MGHSRNDITYMRAALRLGRRNRGQTWPNPAVGALIVRDGPGGPQIVGRGWTDCGGRPHAETRALEQAGELARGATCYVSLEPCNHVGKTGPCTQALIAAGIGRTVIAVGDPDPRTAGTGITCLMQAGMDVQTGCCEPEGRSDHVGHIRRMRDGRPNILLKLAVSSDGFIGRRSVGNVPISGPAAGRWVHGLRATNDGVMIGVGTLLADNPRLDCRLAGLAARSPVRIVLDSRARTPLDAHMVLTARDHPVWVVCSHQAERANVEKLEKAGVRILRASIGKGGWLDLAGVLQTLADEGLTSVLVEGGARLARSLVEGGLVDYAELFVSRKALGACDDAVEALAGLPFDAGNLTGAKPFEVRQVGADHLYRYQLG